MPEDLSPRGLDEDRCRECWVRLRVRRRCVVAKLFRRASWVNFEVYSLLCFLVILGLDGECVGTDGCWLNLMRGAVGVDENGACDLLNHGAAGRWLCRPTGHAVG